MPKHVDHDHTKKQSFGRLPGADESDSEESSGRMLLGSLSLVVYQLRSTLTPPLPQTTHNS